MDVHTRIRENGQPESAPQPFRVLFVCLGNICRSVAAEHTFNAAVKAAGLAGHVESDSCGTAAYHVGEKPDARMRDALARAGYEYNGHRGRQFTRRDFAAFDLIVPQDDSNYEDVIALASSPEEMARVVPMSAWFADDCPLHEVPDPYYGGIQGFDDVVALLAVATRQMVSDIARAEA
ncbi:MAG: low molecular weight phosphotyrosine protein phosphatase [Akkermansia sp.]|nr:low molecular weight phosphotyrosine protein phosphatase [Akkermansia sp.]